MPADPHLIPLEQLGALLNLLSTKAEALTDAAITLDPGGNPGPRGWPGVTPARTTTLRRFTQDLIPPWGIAGRQTPLGRIAAAPLPTTRDVLARLLEDLRWDIWEDQFEAGREAQVGAGWGKEGNRPFEESEEKWLKRRLSQGRRKAMREAPILATKLRAKRRLEKSARQVVARELGKLRKMATPGGARAEARYQRMRLLPSPLRPMTGDARLRRMQTERLKWFLSTGGIVRQTPEGIVSLSAELARRAGDTPMSRRGLMVKSAEEAVKQIAKKMGGLPDLGAVPKSRRQMLQIVLRGMMR